MKMLVKVKFPHEPFNDEVRKGTIGKTVKSILDDIKPDASCLSQLNYRYFLGAKDIIVLNN